MNLVILITCLHFIGDFVLQNTYMALNKSKQLLPLLFHCTVYTIVFIPFVPNLEFIALVWITHFLVDYFSSKVTAYLWKKNEVHWFFVVIGFDQLLHINILFGLLFYIYA